jgi:hypothetical protein
MDSPVKFDLSQLSYSAVLIITLPFISGGVFLCGSLYINLAGSRLLVTTPDLPTAAKVTLALFAAYVIGLLLHFTTNALTGSAGWMIGYLIGSRMSKTETIVPWQNSVWRKVARRYLGWLAPSTDEPYFPEIHRQALKDAMAMTDPELQQRALAYCEQTYNPRQAADLNGPSGFGFCRRDFPGAGGTIQGCSRGRPCRPLFIQSVGLV